MEITIKLEKVLAFFKRNWFQLALVLLGLYFFFIKDISLNIHVAAPDKTDKRPAMKQKEKYTDAGQSAIAADAASPDRMEVPFIGGGTAQRSARSELAAIEESAKLAFLDRFGRVALAEQERFGVPSSIVLATALHQSFAGKRDLALAANNFFAMPCSGDWKGHCQNFQGSRYRQYATPWESFRDFSLFTKSNFAHLKGKDYKTWASAMQKAGFSGEDDFAKTIAGIVQQYKLHELDR